MNAGTQLAAVIRKEITQTVRDPRVLAVLVVVPVFQLLVLGYAVDLDVSQVPIMVVDQDSTPASRGVASRLLAGDTFVLAGTTDRPSEGLERLERGEVSGVLVLPHGFGDDLATGHTAQLQLLADGTDSNRAIIAQDAVAAFAIRESMARVTQQLMAAASARGALPQVPRLRVEPRLYYNPTLESAQYFVPGIAATLLLIVTIIVTSMGLAREKEAGTLEQVLVTPIPPSSLIAGKMLPYAFIGLFDLLLVVTAAMWVFDVPLRGDLLLLFVSGGIYLLTILSIGLLLSTLSANQQQAFMTAFFFILPAMLLSGFLPPISNMPEVLQVASAFNPVRHYVEIMRAVMLKGSSWQDLLPRVAALSGMCVCFFSLALSAMRRNLV